MIDQVNRTFICSVVYYDIADYSKKTVEVQIRLKELLNRFTNEAIKDVADNERIILDTGDGAAICFLGDPEDALFAAIHLRDAVATATDDFSGSPLRVRFGINLGPVKVVNDINNRKNIIGDGINVGQRIMSFADPGQILVSRSYYEVASCLTQEYAKLFHYLGTRADKHVRQHEVYAILSISEQGAPILPKESRPLDHPMNPARNAISDADRASSPPDSTGVLEDNPKKEFRRASTTPFKRQQPQRYKGLAYGGIAIVLAISLYFLAQWNSGGRRTQPDSIAPPPATQLNSPDPSPPVISPPADNAGAKKTDPPAPTLMPTPLQTPPVPEPVREPESPVTSQPDQTASPEKATAEKTDLEMPVPSSPALDTVSRPETSSPPLPEPSPIKENGAPEPKIQPDTPAAVQEATLLFAVTPWGEVSVDGKHLGASPPLISLAISPGKHVIEITNTAFAPFSQTVDIAPNEKLKISHKFK